MTIWCISKYASPPKYSKMPARLFSLAKEFRKLGHETILITSDSNHLASYPNTKETYNFEIIDSVPTYWIKTKKYLKTASIARVLSWFDFEKKLFGLNTKEMKKADVVLVSSLSLLTILYGFYLKKRYKAFLVFEIRDIWPLTLTEEGGFSKWHPLVLFLGYIERFGYRVADLIVGTMPKLDLHVKSILGYDKPFFCSPLGFNPEDYFETKQTVSLSDGIQFPENKVIVGYAGSMGITNALEPFIEAIKLLKNNPNIHFMLVGSGDLKRKYQDELQTCKNVTFLPRIEQKEVNTFLKKCDILYLSTKHSKVWTYGQSMNKVVEYMLAAKPIVASYSGYPSMINEAKCGVFIKSSDPQEIGRTIEQIAYMPEKEREEMGERGRRWIESNRRYSLLAKQYIEKIEHEMGLKQK